MRITGLTVLAVVILTGCASDSKPEPKQDAPPRIEFGIGMVRVERHGQPEVWLTWQDGKVVESDRGPTGRVERKVFFEIQNAPEDAEVLNALANNLWIGYAEGPLSPFGISNPRFNYHVFWDIDVWVYPALALLSPEVAQRVPALRVSQADAARQNFLAWEQAGFPVARGEFRTPIAELTKQARVEPLMYPWEADSAGREASPSDTRHEHHITGDVAWMLDRAILFGDIPRDAAEPVIAGCAAFFLHRLDRNPDGSHGLRNVVSPDEWHTVDNDLYTNAIADFTIRRGQPDAWRPDLVGRPRDSRGLITFDEDTFDRYQQAAALLAVWPLQDSAALQEAESLYMRYRGKSEPTSPAMSLSIEATIGARLGHREQAYRDWRASWLSYTDEPSTVFREKPKGESYFLTGAAGCVNVVLYGFLGAEISNRDPGTHGIPLAGGGFLTFDPMLPEAWPEVSLMFPVRGLGQVQLKADHHGYTIVVEGVKRFDSRQQPPIPPGR